MPALLALPLALGLAVPFTAEEALETEEAAEAETELRALETMEFTEEIADDADDSIDAIIDEAELFLASVRRIRFTQL